MTTTNRPELLRDIPMGAEGDRGRLLQVGGDRDGVFRFVFYRGTNKRARKLVAECDVGGLRDLHEANEAVERRAATSVEIGWAIAEALDLPMADREVVRIVRYLEATAR